MTSSRSAFCALLLIDVFALPMLIVIASYSPLAGIIGGLLVMLIHPLVLWRL